MYWVSIVIIGILSIAMVWAISIMIINIKRERNEL